MSNIHSLADYRSSGAAPYRAAASSPSTSYQGGGGGAARPHFGTIGGLRGSEQPLTAPAAGGFNEPARDGVSFFRSPDVVPGTSPTLGQQCCPRHGWRYLTTVIALVNVVIFIIELIVGSAKFGCAFDRDNQMGGPNTRTLYCTGGKWTPAIEAGAVWRLITPIFLHAGVLHIAGNLFMLLRFGYILETRWGWWRFGLVYLLAGIGASLWSAELGTESVSVGASGAIMGLMGSDIVYVLYNFHEIPDVKVEAAFIAITVTINFIFGLSQVGIDNYAHLGGLIMGLPLGCWFVPLVEKREKERLYRWAAGATYIALFVLFCFLIFVGKPAPSNLSETVFDCSLSQSSC